ncbi:MAG TPA: hypothetical protein VFO85_01700, partial [Vicinamibacteria bacterium]|nr:hypothetical protein [Vicinamibacteria bacterium]
MNGQEKGTSPWVWVGLGCLGAVLLAVAAVVAVGFFGYRKVKQLEADLKDPSARADKVKRVLGTDRLPPGYHAVMAMSVPLVMDMAMLSDVEPDFEGGRRRGSPLGQRGFFYVQTLSPGNDKQELRDYFEGRSDDADVLRRNHVKLDRRGETLRRGTLPLDGGTLMY